jgi:hypothetical protein
MNSTMNDPLNMCYSLPPKLMATETTPLFIAAMRGGRYSSDFVFDELDWAKKIDTKLLHPHTAEWKPPKQSEVDAFADTHANLIPVAVISDEDWFYVKPGRWRRLWNWIRGKEEK